MIQSKAMDPAESTYTSDFGVSSQTKTMDITKTAYIADTPSRAFTSVTLR